MVEIKKSTPRNRKRIVLHDHDDDDEEVEEMIDDVQKIDTKVAKQNKREMRKMHEKYSIEKYRAILDYFRDVQVLTPDSPQYIVEKVRNLAEFLVYGQKFDQSIYFEEFIEENIC